MKNHAPLLRTVACLVLCASSAAGDEPKRVTQADLLSRMIDVQRLCLPAAMGERSGMVSGVAAASKDADGWFPLARLDGPGAITRLWFDRLGGTLRIRIDGEIAVELPLAELMSGQTGPFLAPLVVPGGGTTTAPATPADVRGVSSYVPIGFAKQCDVFAKGLESAYELSHVRFGDGVEVESFTLTPDDKTQTALKAVATALNRGLTDREIYGDYRPMPVAAQQDVGPGEKLTETLDGDGIVRALHVALTDKSDPREPYALHRIVLRVFVDGEHEPSVEAPLSALFGSGYELELFNAVALGTYKDLRIPLPDRRLGQDHFMFLSFPMPYRNGLRLEIENLNKRKKPIGLLLIMNVDTRTPPDGALSFNARFRREDPCSTDTFTLFEAAGTGRLVGCTALADVPRRAWWGAGPLRLRIDDADFTGIGGALLGVRSDGAVPGAFPFHGVVRTGPYGKTAGYRLFLPDAIEFQRSVRLALASEQPANERDVFLAVVAYWYGPPAKAGLFARLTEAELRVPGFRLPNTVEIEGNIRTPNWGNPVKEEFTGVELSGGIAASISLDQPVEINIPSDRARSVGLKLRAVPGRPFEKITISAPSGKLLATLEYARMPDGVFEIGTVALQAGDNVFTVQCTRPAMLDCWVLDEP